MVVRVFGSQTFGTGCYYEIIISGDKGQAREASYNQRFVSGQCCRQLHGVVATQPMVLG